MLKRVDLFGAQIPGFNLKGETQILTKTGGCLSVLLVLVWAIYGIIKFSEMVGKQNPFISETNEPNFYDYKTHINLNDIGFKLAFSVESYFDAEMKADPRYVKYIVRIFGIKEGEPF